jgi:hypothetical protein
MELEQLSELTVQRDFTLHDDSLYIATKSKLSATCRSPKFHAALNCIAISTVPNEEDKNTDFT